MVLVVKHGIEKLSNNVAMVSQVGSVIHVVLNPKELPTQLQYTLYKISNSFDFGAIDVFDELAEAFINPKEILSPGLTRIG